MTMKLDAADVFVLEDRQAVMVRLPSFEWDLRSGVRVRLHGPGMTLDATQTGVGNHEGRATVQLKLDGEWSASREVLRAMLASGSVTLELEPGPFQIEPYESDGHMRWEIDLASMKATLLLESFDDVWNGTTFDLRRSDGGWQYYEDADTWKARVDGLAEQLFRTNINFSGLSLNGDVKNLVIDAQTEVKTQLAEARARGPSWIDLPKDVSKAIEIRWKEQRRAP
jgi:hypothetical protein